jgi:hypothetical protein
MKKTFENPELDVVTMMVEDILTTSGKLEGWAPDSDDSEFG